MKTKSISYVLRDFLESIKQKKCGGALANLAITDFCEWIIRTSIKGNRDEYLRQCSETVLELCVDIKLSESISESRCRRMANQIYPLSLSLRNNLQDWLYAVGTDNIERFRGSAEEQLYEVLDALKHFDDICCWNEFPNWVSRYIDSDLVSGIHVLELETVDNVQTDYPSQPVKLFYSYSHNDEELREQLEKHLAVLEKNRIIAGWHDRGIPPGTEWANQIDENLKSASIILLLVSADFLSSKYCYDIELEYALKLHAERKALVIPVILRPCLWQKSKFGKLQALPKDGKPITDFPYPPSYDAGFLEVAKGIEFAVNILRQG